MITEVFIENSPVDISADLSALLTFQIDDVKDFASRNTSFSKTIVLPGTKRNNKLFGGIYDVKIGNFNDPTLPNIGYNFNAAKSAKCEIYQGNIQAFKGVIRLLEVILDRGNIEYEVAVFGELGGLISKISNAKIEDLDFSAYDHLWTSGNIVASWNSINGAGYYYPLIDYGAASVGKHNWDIRTFRPAFYVKEILDKMFAGAGYTYTSALFNTTRFKSLIIPNNRKGLQKLSNNTFLVTAQSHSYNGVSDPLSLVPFPNQIIVNGFTPNGTFDQYTNTASFAGTLTTTIRGSYTKTLGSTLSFSFKKGATVMSSQTFGIGVTSGTFDITLTATAISVNDVISVEFNGPPSANVTISTADIKNNIAIPTFIDANPGDFIKLNENLPLNILQKDFFSSILKLFNLYVFEDKDKGNHVVITPQVDFYDTNPGNAVDWTNKINRHKPIKLKPLSELNARLYEFKFKKDTDHYNDLYFKKFNEGYGDRLYDSEFEFAKDKHTIELIFSATPLIGYAGEEKVVPTIFKLTKTNTTELEEKIESNIRIMLAKKVTGVASWDMKNGTGTETTQTVYGYAGHFDDPDAPTNDLNFGATHELYFSLLSGFISANQFNIYWSSIMAEITDKDSKLLSGYFVLNTLDIYNLDFSKFVYVDGSLFRLNKIEDYNASRPDECRVELLKVIETTY